MKEDPQLDAFSVDVRDLLERNVASLYSHLVTRPTGRAVRMAIESQIDELDRPAISLVDLSAVAILDYSCADEVVAKLLIGSRERENGGYLVLRGVKPHHREPIEEVLARHDLAVVSQVETSRFEVLGSGSSRERGLWDAIEEAGRVRSEDLPSLLGPEGSAAALDRLVSLRLVFVDPYAGDVHALSTLILGPE